MAWGLIDWHAIGHILRRHPRERIVLLVTWLGVLVDLEKGLFVGIVVSLLFYVSRTSQPAVDERVPPAAELHNPRRKMVAAGPQAPGCPQLAMLRLRGSIYFGAVEHVREQFHNVDEHDPQRKWVLLLAQGVNFVDLAGAELLAEEAGRRLYAEPLVAAAFLPSLLLAGASCQTAESCVTTRSRWGGCGARGASAASRTSRTTSSCTATPRSA